MKHKKPEIVLRFGIIKVEVTREQRKLIEFIINFLKVVIPSITLILIILDRIGR